MKVGLGQSKDNEEEEEVEGVKNKSLPISTLIELLQQKTGKEDIDVGKLRPTLFDVFGEDASAKVKKFMNFTFGKIKGGNGEEVQRSMHNSELATRKPKARKHQCKPSGHRNESYAWLCGSSANNYRAIRESCPSRAHMHDTRYVR
ncbi:hypothetical protein SASPL_105536 [Salvia splendens]|uniref:Uncharacterized protein n=1 Tax=Salvia splendens TaxID=180675 RepID=A0A8X9A9E3_SALSN|nr:hypothetical protein SASPL_105536 [Salvia splendens]